MSPQGGRYSCRLKKRKTTKQLWGCGIKAYMSFTRNYGLDDRIVA